MSRPGRLLLAQMRPDPPGAVEERLRRRAAGEQAVRERQERFPGFVRGERIQEALDWQEARIAELLGGRR